MTSHDSSGRKQETYVIDEQTLTMWLATISVGKIAEHMRDKLVVYQKECARVLHEHFCGGRPVPIAITSAAAPRYLPWMARISVSLQKHMAYINAKSPGSWSILTAINQFMLLVEDELLRHCLPVKYGDRPDGSVGLAWATYRRSVLGLADPVEHAPLYLPDQRRTVMVRLYSAAERGAFEIWFYNTYIPEHLPKYLATKYAKSFTKLVTDSAAENSCGRVIMDGHVILPKKRRLALDAAGGFVSAGSLPAPERKALPAPVPV